MYGKELVLDLVNVKALPVTRRKLDLFLKNLCDLIDMDREELHFWDYSPEEYETKPAHLKGVSACQFISTSTIVVHTLDDLQQVFINIFACKDFDVVSATEFCAGYFRADVSKSHVFERG